MEIRDLTIIGGGPTGLAAVFRAGMHEATARIIEVLPNLGGQMTALYPEKFVFDVFGLPKILARDLVKNLEAQALQFHPEIHLDELATNLRHVAAENSADFPAAGGQGGDTRLIEVTTTRGVYLSRAVIITSGNGIISPRKLPNERADEFEGRGIVYSVQRKENFRNKRVVIVGGGDSAADWVLNLAEVAAEITLVHRSNDFAAHPASVREIMQLASRGRVKVYTSTIIDELHGNEHLEAITLRDWRQNQHRLELDVLLPMIGFKINLGPIATWGLELEDKHIKVDPRMRTNLAGVFAAGDVATFPGKIKLIATGFAEAAMAVKSALEYIHPSEKVKVTYSSTSGLPAARI
ncbi:MAG: NAD(P)/FAD-dependent oxidoreductase [candidate division KSB1 bacterium]|nr:NAD(P)/FAD-dependent oxidoreductase [candidate division KSB1 bacterium]MDZ7274080.1 NAD(P)/FAD-dependent oxidoreductase [candidate division KSB1 bacterium]MDZ7287874.1 NAD(P)/FAD-dependent oxidoreductase [candidate division KSB1 bacterium]MDZ7296680.1 NAD(P)/FAD-dependent oxidoreductase [candidate division KSB1 bacterium]MDZ7309428.1 NAD(P)/FAD-dependent oxidoreductase [candidate division KSB1 bacterium]